jgi:hypothetical protein
VSDVYGGPWFFFLFLNPRLTLVDGAAGDAYIVYKEGDKGHIMVRDVVDTDSYVETVNSMTSAALLSTSLAPLPDNVQG